VTARLPNAEQALALLSRQGRHFPEADRMLRGLSAVTYRDRHGTHPVSLDTHALTGTGHFYANNPELAALAASLGPRLGGRANAILPTIRMAQSNGMVWGFSGFAMPGHPYRIEMQGMTELLTMLLNMGQLPSLLCDGGVSDGILGLAGVLAKHFGVPSLGYAPLEGLASIGPRDLLVAHKHTYQQREILVGITPDVLVCVGGGPGSQRECEKAIQNGGIVVLLSLREYDYDQAVIKTYRSSKVLREAADDGTFIICGSVPIMRERLPRILHVARRYSLPSRSERLIKLERELT